MGKNKILVLFLGCSFALFSQKYNFVNWTVEDGLIQSQASFISQDRFNRLWIGTEGGASCFDGNNFLDFTIHQGLSSNNINCILCDKKGNLWFGSNYGISVYSGKTFNTIELSKNPLNVITQMQELDHGDVLALSNYKLYRIKNHIAQKECISGDTAERVSEFLVDRVGNITACVYKKGLYKQEDKGWKIFYPFSDLENNLYIRERFINSKNDTFILSNKGLLKFQNGKLRSFIIEKQNSTELNVLCIAEDAQENLWLGTDNGLYKIEGEKLVRFDQASGFTDNSVNHIFKDVENNLWFATNGDGIFKYRGNTFTYYDKTSGFSNTIITGVVQTQTGVIYTGGYGGGLYKITGSGKLEKVFHNGAVLENSRINVLYADRENNVWIGTESKGTYYYNEQKGLTQLNSNSKNEPEIRSSTCFLEDTRGNMLVGTNRGLFLREKNGSITKLDLSDKLVTALNQFDSAHIIAATSKGLFLMNENYHAEPFYEKQLGNASVLCLSKNKDNLWIGTTDKGVLNLNFRTNKIISYTSNDGLPSNFIYSIDVSDKNKAWIGTGFGICNLQTDSQGKVIAIKNYGRSDGLFGMECNHNSLLKAKDSSLWFGTTKGLFHFNPQTDINEKNQPLVLLRSVKLFSSTISDSTLYTNSGTWFSVPEGLKLGSKQNHLSFELGSIYFTNPGDVEYRYKLDGIDKAFSTTTNPDILYPSLPPGKYTLRVMGITKNGVLSKNEITYHFEIEKAFYQTRTFQIFSIIALLATGALFAYLTTRARQKRKQKAKELLERIREEEFMKLRQRTAEDFHDEMGNNLTRISILTDMLKSKLNNKEPEISSLVDQIKENTGSLYKGSRDIIWSLNSKNDDLYEIAEHIKDIGNELFHDTSVDFNYEHNFDPDSGLKLKLDYSRNLTMIFKEAFSNILKHSDATLVDVKLEQRNKGIEIVIKDNGKGIDPNKKSKGNGIKNMKTRTSRMNGYFNLNLALTQGTQINIELNDIFI
ncbi:MAG: hypothetical protein JNL60_09485 [Bacteroidia bacterium]|nr:hypothetical protein [Bacteroidia bacterium]